MNGDFYHHLKSYLSYQNELAEIRFPKVKRAQSAEIESKAAGVDLLLLIPATLGTSEAQVIEKMQRAAEKLGLKVVADSMSLPSRHCINLQGRASYPRAHQLLPEQKKQLWSEIQSLA